MQTKNPAPIDGYFQPQVMLGQRVTAGDLLGVVSDELGDVCEEVRSAQTGLVLVLRTFPRVSQGDGLGVVLELET